MARWTTMVALLALAGCAGEGNNGDSDAPSGTCDGNPITFRVHTIDVAASTQGFDLDDHNTTVSSDEIGCGIVDGPDGIDNELFGLQNTISSYFDLAGSIDESIESGAMVVEFTVRGYDGDDDDCVLVDVTANGDSVAAGVEAEVVGGVLETEIEAFPLKGDFDVGGGQTVALDITLRDVQATFPIGGDPLVIDQGILGGAIPWDDPTTEADLKTMILDSVGSTFFGIVEGLVLGMLDIQPPDAPETSNCDALSAALRVSASQPTQ
jgi:hypothetical protein